MNNRIKDLFSNTLLFTIANFSSKLLVFLMVPLYTSVLTPNDYGITNLLQTTCNLLYPILTLSVSEAVLRFCFIDIYDKRQILCFSFRIVVIGTVISALVGILFSYIPLFQDLGKFVYFIPVLFVLNALLRILHSYARGINKVRTSATGGVFNTFLIVCFNIIFLVVFKIGVLGFLLSYVISDFIIVLYIAIKCNIVNLLSYKRNFELEHSMLSYSFPLMPNSISWWALDSFNQYLILSILGLSYVGMYSAALKIPSILTICSEIFAQAWLLSALKDYGTNESKIFIDKVYSLYFSVLVIFSSIIIILSYPFARFLLSGEYVESWYLIPFLYNSVFWGASVGFYGSIFAAERKNIMQLVSTLCGAIVSVLIALLFTKAYGLYAIVFANLVGYFIIWIIRRLYVDRFVRLRYSVGMSLLNGFLLLIEAVFVTTGNTIIAIICIIPIIYLNRNNLNKIISFSMVKLKK